MTVTNHGVFDLIIKDNVAVMDFNVTNLRYSQDLITSSFEREKRYVFKLIGYDWAPELLEVNPHTRQIAFKWYDNTCESELPDNYIEQLTQITRDLKTEKIYKPSFYPKYFYTDKNNKIHAYAFYSSSDYSEQPIAMDFYRPILNPKRAKVVDDLEVNGMLDMKLLVERAFKDYIEWPGNPLPDIYKLVMDTENF